MGTRPLILYVIYQIIISESLGGVTLPFSDLIGKVTPVKPKPLSPSIVSSSGTSPVTKSSLLWDGEDIMPKLFSPAAGGSVFREFSSPLAFTSSSRALPVPKIDSSSITDLKLPERLREKFLSSKLCNTPAKNAKPDIHTPEVSLPYNRKYPLLSSPTKLPNTLPTYSSPDMYSTSLNKLSSLPSIKSLPIVPLESLKSNSFDLLSSASKTDNLLAPRSTYSLPRSRIFDSPLTLEARKPSFLRQCSSSSTSSPYPLYYRSMYLPGVRIPSGIMPLKYRPISNTGNQNFNIPSQCNTQNLLSSLSERNKMSVSPYLNPITTSEMSKPVNMIQVPKTSSNVPFSTKPVFSAQNAAVKNLCLRPLLEANSGSASLAFKSKFEPSESLISSFDFRGDKDPKTLLSSLSYAFADKISDCKQKPLNPPKISSSIKASMPLVSSTDHPTCFNFDALPNFMGNIDINACVENIDRINSNDHIRNSQPIDLDNVPRLKRIHFPVSIKRPDITSNQYPPLPEECISNSLKFSPPIIPLEPTPSIFSRTSTFSPNICYPSKILQTPVTTTSYINQSPVSSLAQSTSNMVSSINKVVSNIAQNILSSYKSYLNSASQNVLKSNPYDYSELKPKQTLSVLPLPPGNSVNPKSILPIISSPIDSTNPPAIDTSTTVLLDVPSSALEVPSSQLLPTSSSQPLAATVSPLTSLTTFSSPQLCPSYLPSPTLPSYATIASPFYMEAPVFKISSSKKDSDVEKLIEAMLLAEILNNDESFNWDDLDTLLALLSIN